jgi:uncharacterized protein YkwD
MQALAVLSAITCFAFLPGCGGNCENGIETYSNWKFVNWEDSWDEVEEEVLVLVNEVRAEGYDCGEYGDMPAALPLTMSYELQQAARFHSWDMAERDYFGHNTPEGCCFVKRTNLFNYEGRALGENIAVGYPTAEDVVQGWADSDGHCQNMMKEKDGDYWVDEIGVGYYPGGGKNKWTMVTGSSGVIRIIIND